MWKRRAASGMTLDELNREKGKAIEKVARRKNKILAKEIYWIIDT
jgi:hypothetical protein